MAPSLARDGRDVTMPSLLAEAAPDLLAARVQMAVTLGFHIVVAVLGVGMPLLILAAEALALRTGDATWRALARRWSKAFAVLFATGAVSGTVLSFELGLLWPKWSAAFGSVVGLPFALEGYAFFLEAIFLGIHLYGWDRLSPRAHLWTGVPIVVAGAASAWFVVTVNSWMNCPQGFVLDAAGRATDVDPWHAMLNPATGAQTAHMLVAAYLVTGFLLATPYAWAALRGRAGTYHRRALALSLALGGIAAPVQVVVGDWAAKVVAATQPVKFAAMEGQWRTEARAPLRLGGWPDEEARTTRLALEIPGALSWLAHGDADAVVQGLDDVAPEDRPPTAIVHVAFQAMVAGGAFLLAVAVWAGAVALVRRRLPASRAFLGCVVAAGPVSVVALEAGWVVTEVGRQPWIVQGVMRTADAVTDAPGIPLVLTVTLLLYLVITAGALVVLTRLARRPLPEEGTPTRAAQ